MTIPTAANIATQAPAYSAPVVFPPVTPSGYKDVGITYILLIFFGALGVHKFYLGKVGMGILYIFTLGLFGIGTLVDIFTINSQVRGVNARISGRGY